MDHVDLLKEKLLLACKIFQSQKLFDGFGHVTLRAAEDRILSTPKMPPGKVSMRDFIILNMKGEKSAPKAHSGVAFDRGARDPRQPAAAIY